jgi:hypothetical protein
VSIIAPSCGFPELSPQHRHSRDHDAGLLVLRRRRWSICGHQSVQLHPPPSYRVESLEALQKLLTSANGSAHSCTSEPVTGGDVTALDGLGGITATAMQPRAHMAGERDDRGHRFHLRLVMVSNDCFGRDVRTC